MVAYSADDLIVGLYKLRDEAIRVRDALRTDGHVDAARRIHAQIMELERLIAKIGGSIDN